MFVCLPLEIVCPVFEFGEEICFHRYVNLPSPFWNLGKKYASPEIWVCLPYFLNLGKILCFPRNMSLSALFWIWGRNMLPQKCLLVCPVLKFGEEICFPRNVRLPSLFFKFGEELCFPRNVSLPSLVRNYGKMCFPRNVSSPSLFSNLGKKYASPEIFVCLPCFEIWGRNMPPQEIVPFPCHWSSFSFWTFDIVNLSFRMRIVPLVSQSFLLHS